MTIRIEHGDMREVLTRLIAEGVTVQSVVCDPPYHLTSIVKRFGAENAAPAKVGKTGAYARASTGFMGKQWDGGDIAFQAETWRLCYDLLPPGGHLLAFSGTRTYHRMACAIEDAGFEVRDAIMWHYGAGFPKSHNVGKKLDATAQRCSCDAHMRSVRHDLDTSDTLSSSPQQDVRKGLHEHCHRQEERAPEGDADAAVRDLREANSSAAVASSPEQGGLLQRLMPEQDILGAASSPRGERARQTQSSEGEPRREKRGMEGRSHLPQAPRKLRERALRPVSAGASLDGEGGRLCDGASPSHGALGGPTAHEGGDGASHRPQAVEQSPEQSGAVAGQSEPQDGGAWPLCRRCGKPVVPDGLGTALKPATEIICLARKPLVGTVAANVQAHGTGALNIDGCRVVAEERPALEHTGRNGNVYGKGLEGSRAIGTTTSGRWPANVVHDGSDEVVSAFPAGDGAHGGANPTGAIKTKTIYGDFAYNNSPSKRDSPSSAARFFYSAKADADDRLGSKHPTVKPVDLMRWLVRLITPPGGTVLDPFAGSGTTGMACMAEGIDCILVEREAEYVADIKRRLAHVRGDDTPLFSNPTEAA